MIANMTIAAEITASVYALSGAATGPFSTVFKYEEATDVEAWLSTNNEPFRKLSAASDYTLSGDDPLEDGGSVTLDSRLLGVDATWPSPSRLALVRATALGQPSAFGEGGSFSPSTCEQALDHIARQAEDLANDGARTVSVPLGETGLVLPAAATRAGNLLEFDRFGKPLANRSAEDLAVAADESLITAAVNAWLEDHVGQGIVETTETPDFSGGTLPSFVLDTSANRLYTPGGVVYSLTRAPIAAPGSPLILFSCAALAGVNRAYLPNSVAGAGPGANMIADSTGQIAHLRAATITENYATGPGGDMTAAKVVLAAGAYLQLLNTNPVIPAGTYTFAVQLRSDVGAGSQTVQGGDFNGSLSSMAMTEGAWSKHTAAVTSDGSTPIFLLLKNTGGSSITVLFDELQFVSGASAPTFADNFDGHGTPELRYTDVIPVDGGGAVDTTGALLMELQLGSFPATTNLTALSMFALVSTEDASTIAAKIIGTDPNEGVADISVNNGLAYALPALPRSQAHARVTLAGRGFATIGLTLTADLGVFYFNGVPIVFNPVTFAGVDKASLMLSGDPMFPFKGKISGYAVYDSALSTVQAVQVTQYLEAKHLDAGFLAVSHPRFEAMASDSIFSPAYSPNNCFDALFTGGRETVGINRAVPGYTIDDINAQMDDWIATIKCARRMGIDITMCLFIGANGGLTLTIDDLRAVWAAWKDAGAQVVACTVLHQIDQDAFNAAVDALNDQIRADSANYDALADFAAAGLVAGDFVDGHEHPNDSGYAKMSPYLEAALDAAAA